MLRIDKVTKRLEAFTLREISLEVKPGDYYVLLGRSGSGKTQLLELICGLTTPDSGHIFMEGRDVTALRVQDREIGLVFQDLALFPHYTVKDNIMYPLNLMKLSLQEKVQRVQRIATEMNITNLLLRKPYYLSGGEKQRVALARTLVTHPKILLLDEPMASIDASLKDNIRRLLRRLNREGQTIIHVTHDYSEAISLATRVGVMHNGRIVQQGTPLEVFNHPVNRFVARYAGIKNFFRVTFITTYKSTVGITEKRTKFKVPGGGYPASALLIIGGSEVLLSRQGAAGMGMNNIHGTIDDVVLSPTGYEISVNAGDYFYVDITHREMEDNNFAAGERVVLSFPSEALRIVSEAHDSQDD